MRTLTGVSRLFLLAAIAVAALLVLGGAYFIGYTGQLERDLSGPQSASGRAAAEIAIIERALGHNGFLKSYRDYWLGDAQARVVLAQRSAEAARAAKTLLQLETDAGAAPAAQEIEAITATFEQAVAAAPAQPPSGLRGVAEDSLKSMPSVAQLETSYLSLSAAIERLRERERTTALQTLGGALDGAQIVILIALAALVFGLAAAAWLMRTRVIYPLDALERSMARAAQGSLGHPIWGAHRRDEIGHLARAGETLRRCLSETSSLKELAETGRLHVTLEGPGAVLFDKVAAQASAAADALQIAAGKASATQRIELNVAIAQLGQACNDVKATAMSLRGDFGQIIDSVRASSQTLLSAATEGRHRVDEVAERFASGSDELGAIASRANERIGAMLAELSATAQGLQQASAATDSIHANEAMRTAITADLKAIADTVNSAADKVRDEVTRLIEHIGEERILPLRDGVVPVALLEGPQLPSTAPKTLADVPRAEVLARLGNLAAEMKAFGSANPEAEDIKAALSELAEEMRQLGTAPTTRRASDDLSITLSRHADLIEANVAAPTETTLREALDAMARELRQVASRARNGSGGEAVALVANAAAALEERARELFAQLEAAMSATPPADEVTFDATSADVEALAGLAAQLEARAETLSEHAALRRFEDPPVASPAELREKALAADLRTDHAIQTVFEAIERLNNVAASLARAGDAERQRRLVG